MQAVGRSPKLTSWGLHLGWDDVVERVREVRKVERGGHEMIIRVQDLSNDEVNDPNREEPQRQRARPEEEKAEAEAFRNGSVDPSLPISAQATK